MIHPFHMNTDDKHFWAVSIIIPIAAWWYFVGRKRYSAKGMK